MGTAAKRCKKRMTQPLLSFDKNSINSIYYINASQVLAILILAHILSISYHSLEHGHLIFVSSIFIQIIQVSYFVSRRYGQNQSYKCPFICKNIKYA